MKKMNNLTAKLVFLTLSFLIGVVLSIQLGIQSPNSQQNISETAAHLQVELTNIREQKENAQKQILELEEKIKILKDSQSQTDTIFKSLQNEIDMYELQSGMTDAQGKGIVIDFAGEDVQQIELLMANFDLLLSVINKLNAAGAEGICINEERVIFTTELRYEEGNLLVNNNPVGRTIQIRAVGDPDTLEATLNMKYGILWEMKNNFGIDSKIEKSNLVQLPKYKQEVQFNFAQIQE